MNFTVWLENYPEFANKGITQGMYTGSCVLADLYLCHTLLAEAENEDAYNYVKGLLTAHVLGLRLMGGNPVEKAQSLESYMSFKVPDANKAFLSLSDTFYGRTVNDIVKLSYLGGYAISFGCVGGACGC